MFFSFCPALSVSSSRKWKAEHLRNASVFRLVVFFCYPVVSVLSFLQSVEWSVGHRHSSSCQTFLLLVGPSFPFAPGRQCSVEGLEEEKVVVSVTRCGFSGEDGFEVNVFSFVSFSRGLVFLVCCVKSPPLRVQRWLFASFLTLFPLRDSFSFYPSWPSQHRCT